MHRIPSVQQSAQSCSSLITWFLPILGSKADFMLRQRNRSFSLCQLRKTLLIHRFEVSRLLYHGESCKVHLHPQMKQVVFSCFLHLFCPGTETFLNWVHALMSA